MRQARRQEILNFIEGLQQAHGEIKSALEKKENVSVQKMLAECQEFAVELGNAIEETEGEGCVTVSHLEKYCEMLFSVFEEINLCTAAGNTVDASKIFKTLKKYLLRVENSVRNDILIHREVVFFPYKASMWDSMESVYLVAKEDPACTVYCVPIPYFDLNEDHSFGKMHYEGHEYPQNIEIIDWQSYRLEERRPDIVFIHNPYDEWNHVTSVHPMYYAKNIKEYTDCLVYIPYFILNEVKAEDKNRQEWIEKIKHFCFLPGTIYANKVIVQSEDMRQIYITEYMEEAKQLNISVTKKQLEAKILGLGSPKIEKIENTQIGNLSVPDKWLKIIQKADGSRKRVIFYNLGVSALLEYGEKWLCKIRDVLSVFKQSQESVAVLWRPHPLIENTMLSMRPELLGQYAEIKREYVDEGWGIYDDTADLDRAVILSDAYYGDGSSVVRLFRQMGKPVMSQAVDVQCNSNSLNLEGDIDEKEILTTEGIIFHDYIYFVANYMLAGAFMRMDMRTWKISYVNDITNYYPGKVSVVGMMIRDKDIAYCLRLDGEMIIIFDLCNNVCDYIDTGFRGEKWGNFVAFEKYGDFLYLFAEKDFFVIKININTKKAEKIYFDKADGRKKVSCGTVCEQEGGMCLFSEQMNEMIVYSMFNNLWKSHSIPKEACGCCFAVYYEDSFFILDVENRIFQWKPEEQKLIKVWENKLYSNRYHYFRNIVVTAQNIVLLPCLGNEIVIIDRKNLAEKIYDEYPEGFKYIASEESAKYVNGCEDEEYFYYLIFCANHILRVRKADGDIGWIKPKLPTKREKCCFASENYETFTEDVIDLKNYIYNITAKTNRNSEPKERIGEKIWDAVR